MSRITGNDFICVGCARTKLGQNTLGRVVTPGRCGICGGRFEMTVRGMIPEGMRFREPDPPPPVEDTYFATWAKESGVMPDEGVRAAFRAGYEKGVEHGTSRERDRLRDALEDSRDE